VHGNHHTTCHIDNCRSFCIREGKSCRGVEHMGHAISAADHCLLFVVHVQLDRNSRECPCNESYFLMYITALDSDCRARIRVSQIYTCIRASNIQYYTDNHICQAAYLSRVFFAYTCIFYLLSCFTKVLTFLIVSLMCKITTGNLIFYYVNSLLND